MSFADNSLIKAKNTAVVATSLDANTADSGPIGDIVNMINKLDAWVQRNLW
jgi:hypothetical protein